MMFGLKGDTGVMCAARTSVLGSALIHGQPILSATRGKCAWDYKRIMQKQGFYVDHVGRPHHCLQTNAGYLRDMT